MNLKSKGQQNVFALYQEIADANFHSFKLKEITLSFFLTLEKNL